MAPDCRAARRGADGSRRRPHHHSLAGCPDRVHVGGAVGGDGGGSRGLKVGMLSGMAEKGQTLVELGVTVDGEGLVIVSGHNGKGRTLKPGP